MSFRDRVNAIASEMPGAELQHPFDQSHDAWKVGGKMFTCIGAVNPGVSVKTPDVETATMLIEVGAAAKAPYFHRSWVQLGEDCPEDELRHRITQSYDIVRGGLTKKAQAALPAREEG
jgi:predicted DNA-binding protein (MmcQ/YjbR family)